MFRSLEIWCCHRLLMIRLPTHQLTLRVLKNWHRVAPKFIFC